MYLKYAAIATAAIHGAASTIMALIIRVMRSSPTMNSAPPITSAVTTASAMSTRRRHPAQTNVQVPLFTDVAETLCNGPIAETMTLTLAQRYMRTMEVLGTLHPLGRIATPATVVQEQRTGITIAHQAAATIRASQMIRDVVIRTVKHAFLT